MHAGRLVIVCGAGLSMAAPSNLPPAWRVAEASFDKYRQTVDPTCDIAMRHDLEAFAGHFADQHTLQSVFIETGGELSSSRPSSDENAQVNQPWRGAVKRHFKGQSAQILKSMLHKMVAGIPAVE